MSRLFRRTGGRAGAAIILISIFLALFCYWLAPDHTENADTQLSGFALQPPGSRVLLLGIRVSDEPDRRGFAFLFRGNPLNRQWIPLAAVPQPQGDSLVFERLGSYKAEAVAGISEFTTETRYFPLGTDRFGRCIFSRLLIGFRVSLLVGVIAVVISLVIGIPLGALGGWFGGRVDAIIMLLINTVWSIPTLLLVFAIVLALGRGIGIIFFAVGLTMWVDVARLVRGQVLALKAMPFVEAAQSMGFGSGRIIVRHVIPNLTGPVLVVTAGNFATAILVESGLSYLGFGVQPPAPSWGSMLYENYGYALAGRPFSALVPALVIAIMVLGFNLLGNALRDALEPGS